MNDPTTIARALRLLESQKRASKSYYLRNKEAIKEKSLNYWRDNRDAINEKRRLAYAVNNAKPPLKVDNELR